LHPVPDYNQQTPLGEREAATAGRNLSSLLTDSGSA
jgi:hypothetical protein